MKCKYNASWATYVGCNTHITATGMPRDVRSTGTSVVYNPT